MSPTAELRYDRELSSSVIGLSVKSLSHSFVWTLELIERGDSAYIIA